MSNELPQNNNKSDEVDLIVFFSLIGNVFNRFLAFIRSIFGGLYSIFIGIAKAVFLNIKLISIVLTIAICLGFAIDAFKSKVYYSEMYVRPFFDSKYELINTIEYYNSLIKLKDYDEFSKQLNISQEEAESIVEFEIEIGPETKNDQITEFNNFLKTFDSVRASKAEFKDFLENRNIYSADIYLIRARAKQYNIFKKLENSIELAMQNDFSEDSKKERDSVLSIEVEKLKKTLVEVRSMKQKYLNILDLEANKTSMVSNLDNAFGLKVDKSDTKEDELLQREVKLLNELSQINKELVTHNTIFDKISSFKEKGLIENIWYKKFKIILPILTLCLLCVFYLTNKFYNHTINYKS